MPLQFYLKSIVHEIANICFTENKHVYLVVLEGSDVVTASVFVSIPHIVLVYVADQ